MFYVIQVARYDKIKAVICVEANDSLAAHPIAVKRWMDSENIPEKSLVSVSLTTKTLYSSEKREGVEKFLSALQEANRDGS